MDWLRTSFGESFIVAIASMLYFCGCHARYFAVSDALDRGDRISTRYKYCIVDSDMKPCRREYKIMPDVFSPNGIPVEVVQRHGAFWEKQDKWSCHGSIANLDTGTKMSRNEAEVLQAIVGYTGLWLIPLGIMAIYSLDIDGEEGVCSYIIKIPGLDDRFVPNLKVYEREDKMTGLCLGLPIPYACYYGNPTPDEFNGRRSFTEHSFSAKDLLSEPSVADQALVYGVASRLKEMEENGIITETVARNAMNARNAIVAEQRKKAAELQAQREAEAKARQLAELRQKQEAERQRQAALEAQRQAALAAQRQRYQQRQQSMPVAQPQQVINQTINNYITIQQAVPQGAQKPELVLKVEDYHYDDITRRGKFSVRFGDGQLDQLEEAREYIRKNIEKIVRDKNIVLETGSMLPPGRYHSLSETLKDGNILEIEFKTE